MIRKIFVVAVLLLIAFGARPAYAQYNPTFITCTPTTVAQGAQVSCEAGYFAPGTSVSWTLNSTPVALGATIAAPDGKAAITFNIPAGFELGAHVVTASGASLPKPSETLTLSANITVVGVAGNNDTNGSGSSGSSGTVTSTLPVTGSSTTTLYAGVGAGLVACGALVLLATRRRRSV